MRKKREKKKREENRDWENETILFQQLFLWLVPNIQQFRSIHINSIQNCLVIRRRISHNLDTTILSKYHPRNKKPYPYPAIFLVTYPLPIIKKKTDLKFLWAIIFVIPFFKLLFDHFGKRLICGLPRRRHILLKMEEKRWLSGKSLEPTDENPREDSLLNRYKLELSSAPTALLKTRSPS